VSDVCCRSKSPRGLGGSSWFCLRSQNNPEEAARLEPAISFGRSIIRRVQAVELPIVKAANLGWQGGSASWRPNSASRIWEGIQVGLRGVAGTDRLATFRTPLRPRSAIIASNSIDLAALPRRRARQRRRASRLAARLWKRPKCKSRPSLLPSFTRTSLSGSTDCP
jgi:hypothetical protein